MDVLSDVLRTLALRGAVFFNAEFSAPWGVRSPESRAIAPYLWPDSGHVIIFHLVIEGDAWAEVENFPRVELTPGDIVIFPHGDPHWLGGGAPGEVMDNGKNLDRIFSQGLSTVRMGGGGSVTRFVCGYMLCEPHVSRFVLAGLPPVLKVNIRSDPAGSWLENSILFSVASAASSSAGAGAVVSKLSEVLFLEALRRYLSTIQDTHSGWLCGARDPEVGKALSLLHQKPAHPWTIGELAASAGVSRAVLAERFRHYLGEPPIGYLTRWRLQLAARLLTTTSRGVAEIATEVGYDSEAAFNRAFKRHFGAPPARFRKGVRDTAAQRAGGGATA